MLLLLVVGPTVLSAVEATSAVSLLATATACSNKFLLIHVEVILMMREATLIVPIIGLVKFKRRRITVIKLPTLLVILIILIPSLTIYERAVIVSDVAVAPLHKLTSFLLTFRRLLLHVLFIASVYSS